MVRIQEKTQKKSASTNVLRFPGSQHPGKRKLFIDNFEIPRFITFI